MSDEDARDTVSTAASSTLPRNPTSGWDRFERALRLLAVVVAGGIVLGALFGLAGLSTSSEAAESGSLQLHVEYAEVSRAGIATPLVIDVSTTDGSPLPAEVEVEILRRYLDMFDENGLDPPPDAVSSDGITEIWTFETDDVSTLSIDFDARLQPNMHYGRDGWVEARDPADPDADPVRVEFHTRVMP
jgi:hypothetical protein